MLNFKFCPLCSTELIEGRKEERWRQYCPSCDFINYKNPIPAVVAIAEREGKILLIKRGMEPRKGIWTLPSGFMEAGETPKNACLRELKEETGMDGEVQNLINIYHEWSNIYGDIVNIFYYVKLGNGEATAGDDADDVSLVPINNMGDLGFKCFKAAFKEFYNNKENYMKN